MSQQKYYAIVTDKGLSKLRAAAQGLGALTLSHMAFGDGNGQETAPSGTAVALVNERYRAPITDKKPHPTNPSILYVEAIIPPGVGGWTLREACIYDADGDLIVIAKTPVMDVALLAEGASTEGLVRLPLVFESAQGVQFLIDPTVLLATQAWVIERIISRPFITVESITLTAPPAAPVSHALYVVPANATGAWAGKTNQMAYWHGAWLFADAPKAKVVGASDTGKYYRRTATGWVEFLVAGDETTPGFLRLATKVEQKAGAIQNAANHPAGTAAAVQAGDWIYAIAGGTGNAITVTLTPVPEAFPKRLHVVFNATNTGPVTINVNGLGNVAITYGDGTALIADEIYGPRVGHLVFDGAKYVLTNPVLWFQRMTPKAAKVAEYFHAQLVFGDLAVSTESVIASLNITGASYIDATGSISMSNNSATLVNVSAFLQLEGVGRSAYLGSMLKDYLQIPTTVSGRWLNLNPAATYTLNLYVFKGAPIGPVIGQDARILAYYG